MIDDVAVPDVLAGFIELYSDTCDLAWTVDNRVLEARLPGPGGIGTEPGILLTYWSASSPESQSDSAFARD